MDFKELDKKYNDFKKAMQEIEDVNSYIDNAFINISYISEEDFAILKQNVVKIMNNFEKQHKDFNNKIDMLLKKARIL